MAAEIRLKKELSEVSKEGDVSGVRAVPISHDNRHLKGTLKGPDGTAYEGGTFEVDIVIPNQYPFEPPRMVREECTTWCSFDINQNIYLAFFSHLIVHSSPFIRNLLQKYGIPTYRRRQEPFVLIF